MSSDSPRNGAAVSAEPFFYVSVNGEETHGNGDVTSTFGVAAGTPPKAPQADQSLYNKGLADGEARAQARYEEALRQTRQEVSDVLAEFASQRASYFEKVEKDVVQLALSIARKILHREAQMDPLLLTGIVRVALDSLNEGVRVRLRTNPQEVRVWREYFDNVGDPLRVPELVGDPSLAAGHCVLETDLGSTHISLETQLKEIEQGFMDLLEQRPRT